MPELGRRTIALHSGWSRLAVGVCSFITVIFAIVGAPTLWSDYSPVLSLLVIALSLILVVRSLRVDFRVYSDGVLVRNVLRTRQLPWESIEAVGWRTWSTLAETRVPMLVLQLRNRKTVSVTATAGLRRQSVDDLVDALERAGCPRGVSLQVTKADLDIWKKREGERTPQL